MIKFLILYDHLNVLNTMDNDGCYKKIINLLEINRQEYIPELYEIIEKINLDNINYNNEERNKIVEILSIIQMVLSGLKILMVKLKY